MNVYMNGQRARYERSKVLSNVEWGGVVEEEVYIGLRAKECFFEVYHEKKGERKREGKN